MSTAPNTSTIGVANTAPPPDTTELYPWLRTGDGLAEREFVGTVREAAGFTVSIEGVQRANGSTRRWVVVERVRPAGRLEPELARQLAAAVSAAAAEIEASR